MLLRVPRRIQPQWKLVQERLRAQCAAAGLDEATDADCFVLATQVLDKALPGRVVSEAEARFDPTALANQLIELNEKVCRLLDRSAEALDGAPAEWKSMPIKK